MKSSLVLVLLVFGILKQYKCAPTENPLLFSMLEARIKLCGSALSEAVLLICDGVYPEVEDSDEDERMQNDEAAPDSDLQRPERAIADECCIFPCYRDDLLNYCGSKRLKYLKQL